MAERYINRYNSFCRSLNNLKKSKSADLEADFAIGSPREVLQTAFTNGLIYDDNVLSMDSFNKTGKD